MKNKAKRLGIFLRILSVLLLSSVILTVAACSNTSVPETAGTTAFEETSVDFWLDELPREMDYGGQEIRFMEDGANVFIAEGEVPQEVVDKAFYEKSLNVAERMNVKPVHYNPEDGYNAFRLMVESHLDELDFALASGSGFISLCLNNYLIDMNKQEEFSVINLDKAWWSEDFTRAINVEDMVFWIMGNLDYTLEHHPCCLFLNNTLYNVVVGNEDGIYQTVIDGKWTLDRLIELTRDAYVDDGDGVVSKGDQFGLKLEGGVGIPAFATSAGAYFSKRDKNNIPYGDITNDINVSVNEKLYDLVHLDGINSDSGSFSGGKVLFSAESADHMGNKFLRNMKDDWTIIPMPKLDENQENYLTALHPAYHVTGIPITVSTDKYELIFSFMEISAAEYRRLVRPAILDDAMKNKYSRDEHTKAMVDLCTDHVTVDLVDLYCSSIGTAAIFNESCQTTRDIASVLARKEKPLNKSLDKIIEQFESVSENQ